MTEKVRGTEHLHKHLGDGKRSIYQIKRELEKEGINIDITSIELIAKENNFRERGLIKTPYRDFSQYGNQHTNRDNTIFTNKGSIEIKNLCKNVCQQREEPSKWKTTKEVYEILTSRGIEVGLRTLQEWAKEKELPMQTNAWNKSIPAPYLWSDENIKDFIAEFSKAIPEAKQELTKKYMKNGMVVSDNLEQLPSAFQVKQFGLALAGLSDEILQLRNATSQLQIETNYQIEQIRREQLEKEKYYRVHKERADSFLDLLKQLIRKRLYRKGLRWDNPSHRSKAYSDYWNEQRDACGFRGIVNANQTEYKSARAFLLEKLDDEDIEY